MITVVVTTNFKMQDSRKVSTYGWIISENCCHRQNFFIPGFLTGFANRG
jgi:hypothetical protein